MRKLLLLMTALLTLGVSGAWAQISVSPSTGVYWKNGAVSSDAWAPIWKSSVTASDGSTPLLVMTAGTGINTANGDIYASTYTLEAPTGYVISSYTLNGTATGGDVTITPSGESATVISSGNSLADALAVTVRAQSTSFVLAGGHLTSVALSVTVSPTPVIVAMTSAGNLPSAYGSFSGQTFTTADASGMAGVTITASTGLTINEATVNVAQYGKCFSLATAAASTNYTVTMTAPSGYVITGYYLGGSANTKDAVHTLTSADGSVSVVASAPPYNNPANAPKVFEVTGLYTNSTYFTINTANKANTLYLPTFYIYVAKASEAYIIPTASLDKPGFPTTAAYNTFRSAIEAEDAEANFATALATLRSATIYPSGTYYIKNRDTGCYAFITDDGELVPRIKIDKSVSHTNNNYLWTVTSDKDAGTCSIVSSLYSNVPFAKGAGTYSDITSSNRTVITTLSTELFSSNNGTTGAFYLNGAHNNNTYTSAGNGNSHVISWNYQNSAGSQWIFEPVDLGTEYTVTVEGLSDGGEDAVTLSDGTIVNLGTGTVYLSETPTTSNITQNEVSGYSIQDGSIVVDTENHTITITYSPSYDVLIANYWSDNDIAAKLANAGQYGYPATDNEYTVALNGVQAALNGGSYTGNATNYNNLRTWYGGFLAAPVVLPTAGFYRIKSSPTWTYANLYLMGVNSTSQATRAALYASSNANYTDKAATWYFDGTYMFNYSNGMPAVKDGSNMLGVATTAEAEATSIAFEKASTAELGSLNVKFATNRYLYANNGYTDAAGGASGLGYNWVVEAVTSLPVTITAAGYATLFAPVALSIPSGVTAYVAADEGKYLTLTAIGGGIIPANTGVILKGNEGTYNFAITTGGSVGSNALMGSVAALARPTGSYILATGTSGVGFYANGATTIPGFKAYLPSGIGEVKSFRFGDVDAIRNISNELKGGEIYDLSGRRVKSPSNGLYIVNGKKVVVK